MYDGDDDVEEEEEKRRRNIKGGREDDRRKLGNAHAISTRWLASAFLPPWHTTYTSLNQVSSTIFILSGLFQSNVLTHEQMYLLSGVIWATE